LFICLGLVVYAGTLAASRDGRRALETAVRHVGLGHSVLAVLTAAATITPFVAHWFGADALAPSPEAAAVFSANLVGFVLPSPHHTPLYAWVLPDLDTKIHLPPVLAAGEAFVGFPFLVLGLLGWRDKQPWVRAARTAALVFFLLALGPHLAVWTADTSLSLPYKWIARLPIFKQNRTPVRFVVVSLLFWSVVVWAGLRRAKQAVATGAGPRASRVLLACLTVWIVAESYGHSEAPFQPTAELRRLALSVPEGAVLNLPPMGDPGFHAALQLFHGRPIATGYLARLSRRQLQRFDDIDRKLAGPPAELGEWLRLGGVATVIVDGPLPTVYQQHLRDVSVHVISLGGRVDLRPVATLGDTEGVGALPDEWNQSDRLEAARRYRLAAVAATQIDVLADDNDVYVVELLEGGRSLAKVRVPRSFGGGLRWRALELPPEAAGRPIDEIEVSAEGGDGTYAVRGIVLGR